MKKLAMIRKDSHQPCPFGLSIPFGCQKAGPTIHRMAPLNILPDPSDEEITAIMEANNHLLLWKADGTPCPYAAKIFPPQEAVECSYDAPSPPNGVPTGSPYFARPMTGIGLDGLYTFPMGYYRDVSIDSNNQHELYGYAQADNLALTEHSDKGNIK